MSTIQHVVESLEERWKEEGIEGKVAAVVVECSSLDEVEKVEEFSVSVCVWRREHHILNTSRFVFSRNTLSVHRVCAVVK